METREKVILAIGLVVAIAIFLFLHDIYLAGIALVLVLTLAIAFQIMGETRGLPPKVSCWLAEDARRILIANSGNNPAMRIHITLVPIDQEYNLPELAPDGTHEFPLPAMIAEAKAVVTWEDPRGRQFSGSFPLSATGKSEDDILKPLFPIFGWK